MPDRRALIYLYDGSFDGLLCCVYESYDKNEIPMDILPGDAQLPLLLPVRTIETDGGRAQRVAKSIPKNMGSQARDFVRNAFLTCHPQKELLILQFLRLGFSRGPSVMNMLTDTAVHAITAAVQQLGREVEHYLGFIRFSEANGALTSQIEPKNIVLPLVSRHFCERFPDERFLIHDKTHGMVLLHEKGSVIICSVDAFEQPEPGAKELRFRELWRLFYDTIEIKERHNPRCRMTHMPKRFWGCMTEFARETKRAAPALLAHAGGGALRLPDINTESS
jgi:probable DNA metabolism protein